MDEMLVHEILDELIPSFEALETQSAAVLQLLKDQGLTTDEEFGPYLERASNGSGVRWLAIRVRMERLLSGAIKSAEKAAAKSEQKEALKSEQSEETHATEEEKEKPDENGKNEETAAAAPDLSQNEPNEGNKQPNRNATKDAA